MFESFAAPSVERVTTTDAYGTVTVRVIERPPSAAIALKWLVRRRHETWSARQRVVLGGDDAAGPVRLDALLRCVDLEALEELPDDALAALDACVAGLKAPPP